MQARRLIEDASFGPETLKAISQAFEEAWLVVGGNFGADTTEAGRLRLATALLSVAREGGRDVEVLKRSALKGMALTYYANPSDRDSN